MQQNQQGAEVSQSGAKNDPGVYELKTKDGVKRLITSAGDDGIPMADALARVGFTRVGPVPSREELLAMQKAQAAKEATPAPAPAKAEVKN